MQSESVCLISSHSTPSTIALNSVSVTAKGNQNLSSVLYSSMSVVVGAAPVIQ